MKKGVRQVLDQQVGPVAHCIAAGRCGIVTKSPWRFFAGFCNGNQVAVLTVIQPHVTRGKDRAIVAYRAVGRVRIQSAGHEDIAVGLARQLDYCGFVQDHEHRRVHGHASQLKTGRGKHLGQLTMKGLSVSLYSDLTGREDQQHPLGSGCGSQPGLHGLRIDCRFQPDPVETPGFNLFMVIR